ncbi:hypothetical protein BU101_12790 [Staphylococcus shinii]|uniref:Uncharacterized protein n=1 Tax=Staphylococcus shinii TaxID=2912228 RepID=A0A418IFE7_9STAP|nr:hypothetical protein BU112_07490 [Staphylococcus shinii]RIN05532.1 hypothetical protein BU101_12790 [Staphylococcus shinii]
MDLSLVFITIDKSFLLIYNFSLYVIAIVQQFNYKNITYKKQMNNEESTILDKLAEKIIMK